LLVTVWTKSDCSQCDMTKKALTRRGVEFVEADLEANPEQLEAFKAAGFLQAPIVVLGDNGRTWSGFRPDLIRDLSFLEPPAEPAP